jgi:short-subunit dehydrogenase
VKQVAEQFGRIDILMNNAGFSFHERHEKSTLEHWRQTMAINIEAMYVLAKLVAPHTMKQRYGRIVNVSSIHSFIYKPKLMPALMLPAKEPSMRGAAALWLSIWRHITFW